MIQAITRYSSMSKKKKKYELSKIQGIDAESVILKLNAVMTEKELYKEENFSIKNAADMLNINVQQLSEILNSFLHKSFSTYINDYKINEAMNLMAQNPDYQITRIALMAGFNSTRTFNRVFVKSTGRTPMDYRRYHSGKIS